VNDKERSCLDLSVPQKISDLLSPEGCIKEPQRSIAEFVETAAKTYSSWQERNWRNKDEDQQRVLNNSTLVDRQGPHKIPHGLDLQPKPKSYK
jgi:hypothetical protein